MKHLIIAPHPDDEVLGCGGTIARRVDRGDDVHVIYVVVADTAQFSEAGFSRADARLREAQEVAELLGFSFELYFQDESLLERLDSYPQRDLIDRFEKSLEVHRPQTIYLPAREDFDQDHRAVFDAAHTALRPHPRQVRHLVPRVLVYEQPKIAWSPQPFQPNAYEDISDYLPQKLQALKLHRSQLRKVPNLRSPENIKALAHLRGAEIGVRYAEGFRALRDVLS